MSALPEQYRKYAAPTGQHPIHGEIELYDEQDPVVYVRSADNPNMSVAVRRSDLQPMARPEPRDLTPQPLIDPLAQRMVGGGLGAGAAGAGLGWGFGQAAAGIAAFGGSSALLVLALLLLASKLGRGGSYREGDTYIDVTNINRWWGKSSTQI